MFQILFQQFDYQSMYQSNEVFGVLYFIGVLLLVVFLLMVTFWVVPFLTKNIEFVD
jgi:steroid 5-alpha reductase family enzyme